MQLMNIVRAALGARRAKAALQLSAVWLLMQADSSVHAKLIGYLLVLRLSART